jgi:pimeloyl-ACP methyl ester carboxylesterase
MASDARKWVFGLLSAGLAALAALHAADAASAAADRGAAKPAAAPISIARQGNFFVPGQYTQTKDGQIMTGQMYVGYQIPARQRHPYPIVMIHGGGQTGEGWYETPDGREGWATYFLRQGYAVYVVDEAARGRSGYFTDAYGPTRRPSTAAAMQRFSVPQDKPLYPQAKLHTQWPGSGEVGDPAFDQFFANQVEDMVDLKRIEAMNRAAVATLLDKVGPAILMVHSQSGPISWGIANDRPAQVKAIVAIEPSGPPFYDLIEQGAPDWFKYDDRLARPYGITNTALTYEPAIPSAEGLKPEQQKAADGPDMARCWLQAEPAHKLPNLARVRIVMIASAASYHLPYDHCTSAYLTQAGVKHDFIRLPSVGIDGNGHFMMIEKNSLEIAAFLGKWMGRNIR